MLSLDPQINYSVFAISVRRPRRLNLFSVLWPTQRFQRFCSCSEQKSTTVFYHFTCKMSHHLCWNLKLSKLSTIRIFANWRGPGWAILDRWRRFTHRIGIVLQALRALAQSSNIKKVWSLIYAWFLGILKWKFQILKISSFNWKRSKIASRHFKRNSFNQFQSQDLIPPIFFSNALATLP